MQILISQTVRSAGVSHERVRKTVVLTLRKLRAPRASLAVHLVGDARMRTLNRDYRGINRPTDVLSFPIKEKNDWGDIFLSIPYLKRQAKRFGVPFEEEFCRMLVHGLLHLAGFDHDTKTHAKRMFALQESLL